MLKLPVMPNSRFFHIDTCYPISEHIQSLIQFPSCQKHKAKLQVINSTDILKYGLKLLILLNISPPYGWTEWQTGEAKNHSHDSNEL